MRGLSRVSRVSQPGRPSSGNRAPDRNSIGNDPGEQELPEIEPGGRAHQRAHPVAEDEQEQDRLDEAGLDPGPVRKNRIASRSHTMPTVRCSSPRLSRSSAGGRPGRSRSRSAHRSLLTPARHARAGPRGQYVLGVLVADLAPGVVQEHVIKGGPVHVHGADPHPGALDEPGTSASPSSANTTRCSSPRRTLKPAASRRMAGRRVVRGDQLNGVRADLAFELHPGCRWPRSGRGR